MGAFDCPICYERLVPPIYQYGVGHLICNSCRIKLKKWNKCPLCPRSTFERLFGIERVVESIRVPCFCPEPGCGFSGPPSTLPDHFTEWHNWPSTAFKYCVQFGLLLQPGPHVLRAQDGTVFLMNVVAAEPLGLGHAISLVCVQPEATEAPFGCSLVFSCFAGHHQISTLAAVRCSSLADGLPKDAFCVVPKTSGGTRVVLQTTIDDEDESYDEDDEEDEDSDDDQEEE